MNPKLIILAIAAACGLSAQVDKTSIIARVPFAFETHGVTMPAGQYELNRSSSMGTMTIRALATGKSIIVRAAVTGDNKKGGNNLEFKRYHDVYFLSAVAYAETGLSAKITVSRREKEMAINITPETFITRAD